MTGTDFQLEGHGDSATLTTNNWNTTNWIRINLPDIEGKVTGANYATINGTPAQIQEIAEKLISNGFSGDTTIVKAEAQRIGPFDPKAVDHEEVARLTAKYKHILVAIGFLGAMRCYLDVPVDEALRRHAQEDGYDDVNVLVIGFDDVFPAYDIGE